MEKKKRIVGLLLIAAFLVGLTMVKSWAFDDTYNSTTPLDGEDFKQGASRIREFKRGWEQRWSVNHVVRDADTNNIYSDTTTTDTEGMHYKVNLVDRDEPDTHAFGGTVWGKDGQCWFRRQDGDSVRIDTDKQSLRESTVIVAASNSLDTEFANYICSGADDQVEIESAIADLPAGGGKVLLMEGTYSLSGSIDITGSNRGCLKGVGKATRLELANGADDYVITVATSGSSIVGIEISSIYIYGNKDHISGSYPAIFFEGAVGETISHVIIRDCWIEDADDDGIELYRVCNSVIENCYIHEPAGNGIGTEYLQNSVIIDCTVKYAGVYGLYLLNYSNENIIVNNRIWLCEDAGINITLSGNNTIANNFIVNTSAGDGIDLVLSDENIISTNYIWSSSAYGLSIDSSSDTTFVIGNFFKGNTSGDVLNEGTGTETTTTNKWQ